MSPRLLLVAGVLAASFSSGLAQSVAQPPSASSLPPPAPAQPAPDAEPELSGDQIFEAYGWIIGDRNNLTALGLSETEIAACLRGIASNARGEEPPVFIGDVAKVAQSFFNERAKQVQERALTANRSEEEQFFAKLDENPAVKKTESGLRYEILEAGTDPKPRLSDTIVAHYVLSFADGQVVESSRERGEPATFPLNGVVAGWQEGLQLIGTGGRIKLYVPGKLGYGDTGSPGGIPPAKLLLFDVELVGIQPPQVQLPTLDQGNLGNTLPSPTP